MISAILPLVFAAVTTVAPTPAPAASGAEPAVSVTLNHQTYDRGDRARVTVRVRDDGYVVVLHTDADGRVRVLFPVDPGDDNFMKAGQDYEIRGRGDRDAFQVTESGSGTVYAAVSLDPFHADEFVRNNHWDYTRLAGDSTTSSDPEAAMTNIVEQMADGAHFDYDVATYTVESAYASNNGAYVGPVSSGYSCFYGSWDPWCDGYYPSPSYLAMAGVTGTGRSFSAPAAATRWAVAAHSRSLRARLASSIAQRRCGACHRSTAHRASTRIVAQRGATTRLAIGMVGAR